VEKAMRIEIITIGGEILSGRTLDTNFNFLARGLNRLGVSPLWHTTVPDARDLLADAVRGALNRADGVIMTGGLGGTPDDITRRVLSQVLERPLILQEEVLRQVEEIYRARGRTPPAAAQSMALLPQGAQLIPNPVGLAPGLLLTTAKGSWICALPGVPEEMRAQVEQFVLPLVERRLGGARGWETILRTAGIPETVLAERIGAKHPAGLEVAYLPHWGGVDLRLVRKSESSLTREEYDAWVAGVRRMLGPAVYGTGEESLESLVGTALTSRGLRLGVAESLSGGGVGAAITRIPGSSRYFMGSVVAYDNEAKYGILGVGRGILLNHGAVSGPAAEAMAAGARRLFQADLAVSTTGIAGPDGATPEKPVGLVYLGLSTPGGETHVRRLYPGRSREAVTGRSVAGALLLLHRHLNGLPLEDPDPGSPGRPARRPDEGGGRG
jgi:nicotinamide-nucleotide amidase